MSKDISKKQNFNNPLAETSLSIVQILVGENLIKASFEQIFFQNLILPSNGLSLGIGVFSIYLGIGCIFRLIRVQQQRIRELEQIEDKSRKSGSKPEM